MLVLTSRDVWAPSRELAFVKVSLTQWLDAGTKVRRWYCVGSGRKYVGAKQVVRGDPLKPGLVPPGLEETDHSGVTERVRPSRQGSEGSVGRTTKGDTEQHSSCTTTWSSGRASEPVCVCRLSQPQGRAVQDKTVPQEFLS